MTHRTLTIFALAATMLGGCYYEVRDARTGRMYYTDEWAAADGYRGPLEFTDHTGARVRLEQAEVMRLDSRDYRDATSPADPVATDPQ